MVQETDREIDPKCYNYKPAPSSSDILAALILHLTEPPLNIKPPQDEQKLAQGLLAAAKKVTNLGLRRFVDADGQLTDEARTSLETLKATGTLVKEDESFIVPLQPPNIRDTLTGKTKMAFSKTGMASFIEAAQAAGKVWEPQ